MSDLHVHYTLHLPGLLPGLNEILHAAGVIYRGKKGGKTTAYSVTMKKPLGERVSFLAGYQRIQPVSACAYTFLLHERDRRRDPDNAAAGAQKVCLDALGAAGLMPLKDGWSGVLDLRQHWVVDPAHVGVTVIAACRACTKEEAVSLAVRAIEGSSFGRVIPSAALPRRTKPAGAAAGGRSAGGG